MWSSYFINLSLNFEIFLNVARTIFPMRLILVRHGETDDNVQRTIGGQQGKPLNEQGQEQAWLVAERLRAEPISVAYVSDLERAVQTAGVILKHHQAVPLKLNTVLREKSYGIYEGKTESELREVIDRSGVPFEEYKPEHGESYLEVRQRALGFYSGLFPQHVADTVLAVTHGGFLTSLLLGLERLPFTAENRQLYRHQNTGVTIVDADRPSAYSFVIFNDASHLSPKPTIG